MARNPLDDPDEGSPVGRMKVGDVKIVPIKDFKTGVDTGRFLKIHRTDRDYCHDLCDAYNEARTRDDVEWFVHNGQVVLGTPDRQTIDRTKLLDQRAEIERQRWLTNHRNPQPWGA